MKKIENSMVRPIIEEEVTCEYCDGEKYVTELRENDREEVVECSVCSGKGYILRRR